MPQTDNVAVQLRDDPICNSADFGDCNLTTAADAHFRHDLKNPLDTSSNLDEDSRIPAPAASSLVQHISVGAEAMIADMIASANAPGIPSADADSSKKAAASPVKSQKKATSIEADADLGNLAAAAYTDGQVLRLDKFHPLRTGMEENMESIWKNHGKVIPKPQNKRVGQENRGLGRAVDDFLDYDLWKIKQNHDAGFGAIRLEKQLRNIIEGPPPPVKDIDFTHDG